MDDPINPLGLKVTTYLLLAELVNNVSVLFGVDVPASDYESGLSILLNTMNHKDGRTFIDAKHMQVLVQKSFVLCPQCQSLTPTTDESQVCQSCGLGFDTREMEVALKKGTARIVNKTQYALKAMLDGTDNRFKIRPEHIVVYDVVPPGTLAYIRWVETHKMTVEQLDALRDAQVDAYKKEKAARDSNLVVPSPEQTDAIVGRKRGK